MVTCRICGDNTISREDMCSVCTMLIKLSIPVHMISNLSCKMQINRLIRRIGYDGLVARRVARVNFIKSNVA